MRTTFLHDLFGLEGKVALITGASGGIGRAIAEAYAWAGAKVALAGRSEKRLQEVRAAIQAGGGQAEYFVCDLEQEHAPQELAAAVYETFGRIDILLNCAGMNRRQPAEEVTSENFDSIVAVNMRSVFFLCQAVQPYMKSQGSGKIINIGSLTVSVALAHVSVYGMTKSALAQLTRTLAVEWAKYNIQVNCLCPGFIQTELTRPLWEDTKRNEWIMQRIPADRLGQPRDLVGMAIFMAAAASDYLTGQTIYIDGGYTVGSHW
jgi:gluconate 5-dehydrogenase